MKKPNFFIVGAPKCGTTSLYNYLKQHPEIFMPDVIKEPHYFADDLHFRKYRITDLEQYLNLFAEAKNEKRIGEASAMYLYSNISAIKIKKFSPSASIIIMLRNPVEMIYSLHSQLLASLDEDIEDFKSALNFEKERKRGANIPRTLTWAVECLYYRDVAKYAQQVQRYFDVFSRDKVQVIIYDDFKNNTESVYRETLRFLNVRQDFQPVFKVLNPNKMLRNKALQNYLIETPQIVRWIGKALMPGPIRGKMRETMMKLNTRYVERKPMDPELRKSLIAEFAPEVEQLSELLGRDLSHWTKS